MPPVDERRLFLALPKLPRAGTAADAALRAFLSSGFGIELCASGREALVGALSAAAKASALHGVVAFDHESTRGALRRLGRFSPATRVALLAADPAWTARAGDGSARPLEVDEVWKLGAADDRALSDVIPSRVRVLSSKRSALAGALAGLLDRRAAAPRPAGLASIVIPTWNGLKYTRDCLESVLKRTSGAFEVIVVDNGSTDGTPRWVRSLRDPRVRLVRHERNLGFARAINAGTAKARGRWIVWLNSDAVVTPGWLEGLIACAERAPWIGAVGPYTNEINGLQRFEKPAYRGLADLPLFSQALALRNAGKARWAHRLTGFCLLVKREALERAGSLDVSFGLGTYEDFDFCLRLRLAGYQLLLAEDVFVHHHGHKTFEANGVALDRLNAVNRDAFVEKWCRRALSFLDELDPHLTAR